MRTICSAAADLRGEIKRVERGGGLSGEEFRQELLEQVDPPPGPSLFGAAVPEAERRIHPVALVRLAGLPDKSGVPIGMAARLGGGGGVAARPVTSSLWAKVRGNR